MVMIGIGCVRAAAIHGAGSDRSEAGNRRPGRPSPGEVYLL
jgi:hypothetical protein